MLGACHVLLRIDSYDDWPSSITRRLETHQGMLLSSEFMENLISSQPFRGIAEDLERFIRENRVVGYHCTKEAEPGFFEKNGLRVLNRKQHQTEFLVQYSHLFSPEELTQIQQDWEDYFPGPQDSGRNGLVWFCLAPDQVVGHGTGRLFRYFGGEAIYMPLTRRPSIAAKLEAIGNPVIVEASIDPNELHTFCELPFALNALSLFHRTKNPEAYIHSREGFLERNVSPDEVLQVTPKDVFFDTYSEWCSL